MREGEEGRARGVGAVAQPVEVTEVPETGTTQQLIQVVVGVVRSMQPPGQEDPASSLFAIQPLIMAPYTLLPPTPQARTWRNTTLLVTTPSLRVMSSQFQMKKLSFPRRRESRLDPRSESGMTQLWRQRGYCARRRSRMTGSSLG